MEINSDICHTFVLFVNISSFYLYLQYKMESPETLQNPPKDQIMLIVAISVSGFIVICILVSIVLYFCWWKKKSRTMVLNEGFKNSQAKRGMSLLANDWLLQTGDVTVNDDEGMMMMMMLMVIILVTGDDGDEWILMVLVVVVVAIMMVMRVMSE